MLLIMISVLVAFVPFAACMFWMQRRAARRSNLVRCVEAMELMKQLLIRIQKHRGLTSGFLSGDEKLITSIRQLSLEIDRTWSTLQRDFPSIMDSELYLGIYSHWQSLSDRWKHCSAENLLDQHNRLILNLLYLIEDYAEENVELVYLGRAQGMDVIWTDLLATIEAIGQTRAIGISVVASGKSSAVERIRLKFLIEKVEQYLAKLNRMISQQAWLSDLAHDSAKQASENAKNLALYIDQNLIQGESEELSAEQFFELASASIEPLDRLFSESAEVIKQQYAA